MLFDAGVDVALLQEIAKPPKGMGPRIETMGVPWADAWDAHDVHGIQSVRDVREDIWRTAVVRLSDRVELTWIRRHLAIMRAPGMAPIILVSMYARWERPHASTGSSWIYADAAAHRLISDIAEFVGSKHGHRIIAAGDLNIYRGYGEIGAIYWRDRYQTVFDRMESMGLRFIGPQQPHGRSATDLPQYIPADIRNVPTFFTSKQTPASAIHQLDHVFASASLADHVQVRAMNGVEEWGLSDHSRVEVTVQSPTSLPASALPVR
jgi:hypothetical protein